MKDQNISDILDSDSQDDKPKPYEIEYKYINGEKIAFRTFKTEIQDGNKTRIVKIYYNEPSKEIMDYICYLESLRYLDEMIKQDLTTKNQYMRIDMRLKKLYLHGRNKMI